jgi:hypothetical protein
MIKLDEAGVRMSLVQGVSSRLADLPARGQKVNSAKRGKRRLCGKRRLPAGRGGILGRPQQTRSRCPLSDHSTTSHGSFPVVSVDSSPNLIMIKPTALAHWTLDVSPLKTCVQSCAVTVYARLPTTRF